MRVISDHLRAMAFLIADVILPSNEGRGYVLRRIIRRAIRHGHNLGQKNAFFYKLVKALVKEMGDAYPELKEAQAKVEKALHQEEDRFAETLEKGMAILENTIKDMKGKEIPGEVVFTSPGCIIDFDSVVKIKSSILFSIIFVSFKVFFANSIEILSCCNSLI